MSICALPMARAFAVRRTSSMDAGVICSVRRAHPCHVARRRRSGGAWRAADLHAGGRAGHRLQSPHGGGRGRKVGNRRKAGGSAVHGNRAARLAGCQRSRICSEGDVRHGFSGGRRYLPAWFRCRLPRPWSERRYRCMERPQTSKTTPTRSAMGDWAGRGHGFAADRLRGFRAPAHLQWRGRSYVEPRVIGDVDRPHDASRGRVHWFVGATTNSADMEGWVAGKIGWLGANRARRICALATQRSDHNGVEWTNVVHGKRAALPATQRPRICSEADVKHGCGDDRQRLPDGFRGPLPGRCRRHLPSLQATGPRYRSRHRRLVPGLRTEGGSAL